MERSKTDIPVGVSNRHVHLDHADFETLFGTGAVPRKYRATRQPGWWAAHETVDLEGPKGLISRVRLVGPHRPKTQVEISRSDALALGVKPPVRGSGAAAGSPGIRIIGPKAAIEIRQGVIVARRHLHVHPLEAQAMGIKDGEVVRIRAGRGGIRELVFEQVLVRVSDQFSLEFHVDTDEANAAWLRTGDQVNIV